MASIEEATAGLLATRDTITALIGTRSYDSVLPNDATEPGDYPAVTFQIIDRPEEPRFVGTAAEHKTVVQFDTWALTGADRRAVSQVLREALRAWNGPWGGVTVRRAFKQSDFDSTEDWGDGGPVPIFRNTQRWTVWIREPSGS